MPVNAAQVATFPRLAFLSPMSMSSTIYNVRGSVPCHPARRRLCSLCTPSTARYRPQRLRSPPVAAGLIPPPFPQAQAAQEALQSSQHPATWRYGRPTLSRSSDRTLTPWWLKFRRCVSNATNTSSKVRFGAPYPPLEAPLGWSRDLQADCVGLCIL